MGKVAFVFPGQGAQKVGMGKAIVDADAAARTTFDAADAALGESLSTLCFEGPEADLMRTANTQPAILTTSIALLRAFGESPDVVAGHSLGEYSANVCAGTLAFEDAVRLVRLRGLAMQDAVPEGAGGMAAVMGVGADALEQICEATDGIVEPVNYNSPGQIVIAGAADAVKRAGEALAAAGGKVIPLAVSAPFHSSLMKPAEERLQAALPSVAFHDAKFPIYANVDASPLESSDATQSALVRQVSRSVRWQQSVERMIADGVALFIEIGPGRVLSGLIGRISKEVKRANIEGPADMDKARALLREIRG
ncbi:MAG: ACP S-malonyltransferase [Polyangiales bacterium]|nr:ACP S-malonyltransferase [Myxococcales bacterium]